MAALLQQRGTGTIDEARRVLDGARHELLARYGPERLAETAYPAYMSRSRAASWLAWSRVAHAQRLAGDAPVHRALDFGSGLGVLLPHLARQARRVDAVDLDVDLPTLMIESLGLANVAAHGEVPARADGYQLVTSLDVLEHVDDLAGIYAALDAVTATDGRWVISGPTENLPYRLARRIAGTEGEGHVRTVRDVFAAVPPTMRHVRSVRLPFGSPWPLFVVGLFERR